MMGHVQEEPEDPCGMGVFSHFPQNGCEIQMQEEIISNGNSQEGTENQLEKDQGKSEIGLVPAIWEPTSQFSLQAICRN